VLMALLSPMALPVYALESAETYIDLRPAKN
jgi:hypothetical protein